MDTNQPLTTTDGTQLDPKVVKVMRAIRDTETSGSKDPYNAYGDSNSSFGAYQWNNGGKPLQQGEVPANWKSDAQKYIGDANAPMTAANQNKAAYLKIKDLKDSGHDPDEIAALWNGARRDSTTNKFTYVNPDYGVRFRQNLTKQNTGTGQGFVTPPNAPPITQGADQQTQDQQPQQDNGLFGIPGKIAGAVGNFAKAATEPVATMLARPYQVAHELIGGETDPEKLAQVPGLSSIYGGFPIPNSAGDVGKDVGRGVETAAFGLNPVAGGAAFGLGGSMEAGNSILSPQTALRTGAGALLGKVAEVAAPYAGKFIGAVTPKFIKNAAGALGEAAEPTVNAVSDFAKNTKILPDFASNAINKGADFINQTPGIIGGLIKSQYGGATGGLTEDALKTQVESDIQKAIGVSGKKSAGVFAGTGAKMRQGAETLFDEAPSISVTDEVGNKIPYDPATASLSQHVQALDQAKENLYSNLEKNLSSASGEGVTVDTTQAQSKLKALIDDVGQPTEVQNRAAQILAKVKQLNTPTQVNTYLKGLNRGLGATMKGTSETISKDADITATQELNNALDKTVTNIGEPADTITVGGKTMTPEEIHSAPLQFTQSLNPQEKASMAKFDQQHSIKQMLDNAIEQKAPAEDIQMLQEQYDKLNPTSPIRDIKNKYSNLKAIENSLVNKAQQMARRASGGLGGGLNDYINAFNLADAFDIITNPMSAVKAGVRAGILSKLGANKNPENMLQDIFSKIQLYRNLQKGIPLPTEGILPKLIKNTTTSGVNRSIAPVQ